MWRPLLTKRLRTNRRKAVEIDIWRLQALFNNFRRILFLNNAILEDMANMERALGGEYVFDRTFLDDSIRAIASRVHHVTYNLNALTGNAYIPLYDRYQEIRTILDDILSGNTITLTGSPALPLSAVGWELEPLVGINLVCLAEIGHHPGCRPAEGFVITTEGTRSLVGVTNGGATPEKRSFPAAEVRAEIAEQLEALLGGGRLRPLSVVITEIDGKELLVRELAEFHLLPGPAGLQVNISRHNDCLDRLGLSPFELASLAIDLPRDASNFIIEPYLRCLNRIIPFFFARLSQSNFKTSGNYTIFVRILPIIAICGTIRTAGGPVGQFETLSIRARLPQSDGEDTYLLRRVYPFELVRSTIAPRPAGFRFPDGNLATSQIVANSFGRGSALLGDRMLKKLAETAMSLERMLGGPLEVQWEIPSEGSFFATAVTPLPVVRQEVPAEELEREKQKATVLFRGGQMVQSGVAAGSVVHVTDEIPAADFPAGAVAVAKMASPQLTPILQRAAAIVTEYGNTTGHLATVARELRLPAIFGLPGVFTELRPETEVTVDAGAKTVYQGVLETLLRGGDRTIEFSPFDCEYRMLRRMLRFIMPLNLIDPEAADFSPQGCRSFHDIIHFCHEKSVDELAHFQERHPQLGSIRTRKMRLDIPMDIRVLDIGGGMNGADNEDEPTAEHVQSGPFSAFLGGLLDPRSQDIAPPVLGLRDILSGMPRSMGLLASPSETLGENLAIISHDYMNLSLRLGYHFSVIDAHLGADGHRNYLYFRFIGGLADQERRNRRARFICDVLKSLDFKVSVKSDLVIGRIKLAQTALLRSALFSLGALTSFSRQRDTGLYSDADTEELFATFTALFLKEHGQSTS